MIKRVIRTASMLLLVLLASCGSEDGTLPANLALNTAEIDSSLRAMARAADGRLVSNGDNVRTTQIVGGTEVADLRYPWMAAIFFRDAASGQFFPGCGGTLVAAQWIVTAAHCVVDSTTGRQLNADDARFLIGNRNLTTDGGVFGSFSRVVVHPDYAADPLQSDIALLQLSAAVNFEPITLANLFNPVPQNGEKAIAAGWGSTFQGGDISPLLRQVELPVVAHNACVPFYSNIPNISLLESLVLCAGGSQFQRRDACQGDSGGPLFVPRGNRFVLAGIISAGLGCASPGVPGVYTRVTGFFDWIDALVNVPAVYDGRDENTVVAVVDTVRVLDANTRITANVARGDTDIYRTSQVSQITLESVQGDADLYVFNNAVFSAASMVCRAEGDTAIDQCSLTGAGNDTVFLAVAGFENADYTLTVSDGAGDIAFSEPATLTLDTPVSGTVPTNITNVYRATTGSRATLTTWSGNADLYVFSTDRFTVDTLLCRSRATGSALDVCDYPTATNVYIAVAGISTSSYSLSISDTVATAAAGGAPCIDTDGDGWGWDGSSTCRVDTTMQSGTPLNNASAVVAECVDTDGDGWGWNGSSSCRINTTVATSTSQTTLTSNCIDSDGDGWGWDGSMSCIP